MKRGDTVEKAQMRKGILEGCILQIIKRESTYGYGISEILKAKGFDEITEGTIYPLLIRLESQDILAAESRYSPLGPKRKYYHLTQKGEAELKCFLFEWERLRTSVDYLIEGDKEE